jgi:predicted negative regulator of RcsB-dependent stress response
MQPPARPDLARALKEAGVQRSAEQNALRNVRKELDQLAAQDSQQRKFNRMMVIVAGIVLAILLVVAWRVVITRAAEQDRKAAPVQIPSKVDMTKKPEPKPAEATK